MKDHLLKSVVLGSLFLCVLALDVQVVRAQSAEGLQISPAIIEDKVNLGEVYRFTIKVTNIAETEKTFNLLAQDITGVDTGGVPIFAEEGINPTSYELSSWVVLPQSQITLQAGQTVSVPFSIRVPAEASPGAHFGGVFFDARPQQLQSTGAAVGTRVGTIINLRIAGDITEEIRLREFSTGKFIYSKPPVDFTTKVENLGNVLARPHGGIEITDMFGKAVGTVEVNASVAAVFPGSDREYSVVWEDEGLTFGRYQALLSFVYGDEGRKTVVRTTSFWILPLQPILIGLGILGAFTLLLYMTIKLYIKRKLHDMGLSARADAGLYSKKYHPVSRVTFVVFGTLFCAIVFLLLLFLIFA